MNQDMQKLLKNGKTSVRIRIFDRSEVWGNVIVSIKSKKGKEIQVLFHDAYHAYAFYRECTSDTLDLLDEYNHLGFMLESGYTFFNIPLN